MIGNPPYGAIIKSDKEIYKKTFYSTEGKFEIFKYFYEISNTLLKKNGILTFITPDTWETLNNFKKLRKLIFNNFKLLSITKSLYDVFTKAKVDTSITILLKIHSEKNNYKLVDSNLCTYKINKLSLNKDFTLNIKDENPLIKKINSKGRELNSFTEIWQGLIAYSTKNQPRIWTSDIKESKEYKKLLFGKDISKYSICWNGTFLKYGEWLHRPRPSYIFENEKILVQRIRNPKLKNRLVCAYDNEKYINGTGLSNILLKEEFQTKYSLKFILGILNSLAINYWFSYYFIDVNIKPEQLRKIPIPVISIAQQQPIITLVDKILAAKKVSPDADTSAEESKIDTLVYKLYGLTENEIKIVEGK